MTMAGARLRPGSPPFLPSLCAVLPQEVATDPPWRTTDNPFLLTCQALAANDEFPGNLN